MTRWLAGSFVVMVMALPGVAATREREELNRIEADVQRLDKELLGLRAKNLTAQPADLPGIREEIERKTREREDLTPRFAEALRKAYVAEPKPDEKLNQMTIEALQEHMAADRWEEAADLGKAMAEK